MKSTSRLSSMETIQKIIDKAHDANQHSKPDEAIEALIEAVKLLSRGQAQKGERNSSVKAVNSQNSNHCPACSGTGFTNICVCR